MNQAATAVATVSPTLPASSAGSAMFISFMQAVFWLGATLFFWWWMRRKYFADL